MIPVSPGRNRLSGPKITQPRRAVLGLSGPKALVLYIAPTVFQKREGVPKGQTQGASSGSPHLHQSEREREHVQHHRIRLRADTSGLKFGLLCVLYGL